MERQFTKDMQVEMHLHTNASLSDGAMSFKKALNVALEKGLKAIAITNHGNTADLVYAYHYLKENHLDINLVFGIETYLINKENLYKIPEKEHNMREHLVLLVKTNEGYQDFCRFISDTERNKDDKGYAVSDVDLLKKHFKGKNGVICQTGCITGPIASEFLYNTKIDREIEKIKKRINRSLSNLGDEYINAYKKVEEVENQIKEIDNEIDRLIPISKKTFKDAKSVIKKETDEKVKAKLQEELDIEMIQKDEAKNKIKELKDYKKEIKKSISVEKKYLTGKKNSIETLNNNKKSLELLENNKRNDDEMYEKAKAKAKILLDIFGKENLYIELMYHGLDEEKIVMPKLVKLAKELKLKTVVTNDVHMAYKEDFKSREYIKNIDAISKKMNYRFLTEADKELYIKTAEEKYEKLCEILEENDVYDALKNTGEMINTITFRGIDSFGKHYPSFKDADETLRRFAREGYVTAYLKDGRTVEIKTKRGGIANRYKDKWDEKYEERFNYEMKIISEMGFSSYFLYIADVICKCKHLYGTPIGPGRGSGAGSIICYLTTITEIDPIKQNLLFERFLNPNRVSMPDIDTDFSKEAREYAINYVTNFYGTKKVAGIMTIAKMGPKDALTYAPKIYAKSIELDQKEFNNIGAEMRAIVGDKKKLSEIENEIMSKFDSNEAALNVFDTAKRLEGTIKSYGQHAAGIISIMDSNVEDFIPLMRAYDNDGNEKMVIQADMISSEADLGFIKFDFLGLKNLNVISACQKIIEKRYGKYVDTYTLSYTDEKVYKDIFSNGNTNFVFQFESDGMKSMLKKLNPSRFADLVLASAVYRPGPMQFIDDIIDCKHTGNKSDIVKRFSVLEDILEETYGFPVFQEQVMKIMTVCAGFSLGHADNVRRFMSKKKVDKLSAERPAFVKGCKETIGASEEDSNWLFDQLMPFAEYGFNKSHAAAYSFISYITAYLKCYYTEEYLCSVMLEQSDKTFQFQNDCKRYGIEILPVSVNSSSVNYSVETKGKVRIGLSAIKGLKTESERIVEDRKNDSFKSLKDFIEKCNIKINSFEACILSGACDEFINNRDIALDFAKDYKKAYETKTSIEKKAFEIENALKTNLSDKEIKNKEKQLKTWKDKLVVINNKLNEMEMPNTFSLSNKEKCAYELKYIGMFIGKSPLDDYDFSDKKYSDLNNVYYGDKVNVVGIVFDYKEITTKTGKNMAFFKIIDKDSIECNCVIFNKTFENMDVKINDNMLVTIKGRIGEDLNEERQLEVFSINLFEKTNELLLIDASDTNLLEKVIIPAIKLYHSKTGLKFAFSNFMGKYRDGSFNVSNNILDIFDEQKVNYLIN